MNITWETVRLKIRNKIYIPLTKRNRKSKLKIEDFTIISNNCWGELCMKVIIFLK